MAAPPDLTYGQDVIKRPSSHRSSGRLDVNLPSSAWLSALVALLAGDPEPALGTGVEPWESPVPFTTLVKGPRSGIRRPERLVIRTDEQWRDLWERHAAPLIPKPYFPQVDFSREMVIAIFRGETNGGFPVEIRQIEERDGVLVVRWYAFSPPPGLPLGVAIRLQPYHIVKLARSPLEVIFEEVVQRPRSKRS